MVDNKTVGRYDDFVKRGISGKKEDVDTLMDALSLRDDLSTAKLVDFALSLVNNKEGINRLKHYLYEGSQIQRNYAALYFKRKGWDDLLIDALSKGRIDMKQATLK
jgi:hypothetical protein